MLELKTKQQLSKDAHHMAKGSEMVRYRSITYIPVDYETREREFPPPPERAMWLPLNREEIRRMAAESYQTLFSSDGELGSFEFMVAQNSIDQRVAASTLLVRTSDGLKQLCTDGALEDPTGEFIPNTVYPMLNTDQKDKDRVFDVIAGWLNSEEEAHSLLYHLATSLAPGYSAVKYVLLLGEGRNGKSVLMKMLLGLFGRDNVSSVTRQHMSEQNPVVCELNGKLLNIVFDGQAEYLKDSGTEKTLIAGESASIRKLYESTPTVVQTNALFIEALNNEPKSKDKSSALQKRLVRFQFPNVYTLDTRFEKSMLTPVALGAFLSLLIDHYVVEEELAEKLAPTQRAMALQLEHMYVNSIGLQFLKYVTESDPLGVQGLLGEQQAKLVSEFKSWRVKEDDLGTWAEPDVMALFAPLLETERRSVRVHGTPRKVRVVTSLKPEAKEFLDTLEGDDDDGTEATVVAD